METIISKIKTDYKKMGKWILFVGSLLFIFAFSHQPGKESEALSQGFADSVQMVFGTLPEEEKFETVDVETGELILVSKSSKKPIDYLKLVRKSAHFLLYFCLAILVFSLLREYHFSLSQCFCISVLFCALYGCSDEFHQLFVPGRLGRVTDVLIDSGGAFLGAFIYFLISKFIFLRKQKKSF